jgi:Ca-activated chloride channel family protein
MAMKIVRIGLLLPLLFLPASGVAQVMTIPTSGFGDVGNHLTGTSGLPVGLDMISGEQMTNDLWGMTTDIKNHAGGEHDSSSVSKLDLKAPWKARHEYEKGYQLLMHKDYQDAIDHLSKATEMYPNFVAAHNALGSAYLDLGQTDHATSEFRQAIDLDEHLPNSHLNLGVAQLALKNYSAAEESLQKASAIAPLDLSLQRALAYGQFMNKDYSGVLETTKNVHAHKHEGSAMVHYFAAGAWEAQNNLSQAQRELETMLREDPKGPAADQVRQLLQQFKSDQSRPAPVRAEAKPVTFTFAAANEPTSEDATRHVQKIMQDVKVKSQIAEAETAEGQASGPGSEATSPGPTEAKAEPGPATMRDPILNIPGGVLHASVDEVAIFFAATDHGKSVTDLKGSDIGIRDNSQAPAAILGFRNETELPLRLGLVIDISDSVSTRFAFEQRAATNFLQKAVTGKDDAAFVVGVNNSVLLVQDFTNDQTKMAHALGELVPSGGTALWDAVAFASDKLASYPDVSPVARVLVVISDGENNSSVSTLKDAIEHAQHGEVAIYTVSTRDFDNDAPDAALGEHALRTMSELTGGAAFSPGSVHRLNNGLADIQQVLRGRYLVAYKPAGFQRNGQYRAIDIKAEKDGHKFKVYARKGYYASEEHPASTDR